MLTIILRGDFGALAGIQFNKGDVMFAGALLAFGLYSALMPRRPETHQLSLIAFTIGCGALLLLPFSIWEFQAGARLKFDALTVATLVYVVIFPSTLAYLFFNRGIALIGPNRAAPFFHLVPVFGSAMAILLLGEQPRLFHLVGYLLVLAGVVIASRQASAAGVVHRVRDAVFSVRQLCEPFLVRLGQASLLAKPGPAGRYGTDLRMMQCDRHTRKTRVNALWWRCAASGVLSRRCDAPSALNAGRIWPRHGRTGSVPSC